MKDPARSGLLAGVTNLGNYAFGAYEEPSTAGLEEYTCEDSVIRHLHWDWICQTMEGVLKVQLHGAKNLRDADGLFGGHSDPYAVVSAGGSYSKTQTLRNTACPVWDSTHYLLIRKHPLEPEFDDKLTITVFDKDTQTGVGCLMNPLNKDDHLGFIQVPLDSLKKGGPQEMNATLQHISCQKEQRRDDGSVHFTVEYLSVEKGLAELNKERSSDAWMDNADFETDDADWKEVTHMTDLGYIATRPVAYVDAKRTGTQAWVHVNQNAKVLVVAFRGTEMNRLKDVLTDLSFRPVSMTAAMASNLYAMQPTAEYLSKGIKLHRGFRNAYDSIREPILRILFDMTGWSEDWTICVTGHSLGGALATLCAFELANRKLIPESNICKLLAAKSGKPRCETPTSPKIGMMNFGAPRVGDGDFAAAYNKTVEESMRVVNTTDLVHFLPPVFYRHTKYEVIVGKTGEVQIDGKNVQSGVYADEVMDLLRKDDPEGKALQENAFLGVSVTTHMQPYYFEIVKAAVKKFFDVDSKQRGHPKRVVKSAEMQRGSSGK